MSGKMKRLNKLLAFPLCAVMLLGLSACFNGGKTVLPPFEELDKISFSNEFFELSPTQKNDCALWREGMISGNGIQGFVTSGSPYSDSLILQNIDFVMPNENPRECPDFTSELEAVKQAIVKGKNIEDDTPYLGLYSFHPGPALRIDREQKRFSSYVRYTDFETGTVGVSYSDKDGKWERTCFTSKADDVIVTKITSSSSGAGVDLSLSFDDLSSTANFGDGPESGMQYKKLAGKGGDYLALVAHYPSFDGSELKNGGYAGLAYVISEGGEKAVAEGEPCTDEAYVGGGKARINISGAGTVYIISVTGRDADMSAFEDFKAEKSFRLVESLKKKAEDFAAKYTVNGSFDYDAALEAHTAVFTPEFNAVEFLPEDGTSRLSNERLISKQKKSGDLLPEMLQKAYYSGRYAYLCCSGHSAPRLYGMWTGEFNTGWGSKFTMDANVNLQTSSMSTSNLRSAVTGYVYFILRQLPDWEENALKTHGFADALQAPVHADGDKAVITETCYSYPFRYWNAGASWMITPLFEALNTYGNMRVALCDEFDLDSVAAVLGIKAGRLAEIKEQGYLTLRGDILFPLLKKSCNYWVQLVSPEYYTRAGKLYYEKGKTELGAGETYAILPSYSPENTPSNYPSPAAANAAIDISACRENIEMLVEIAGSLGEDVDEKYLDLLSHLPPYLYDENGALKEWAAKSFEENNEHRHLSHLYCAWPIDEVQNNEELKEGCIRALSLRTSENAVSHALVQRALIAERLKDSKTAAEALETLLKSDIMYSSLMTNHDLDRNSCYCTDFALGYLGIINEALVYSDNGTVELLPALSAFGIDSGSVKGLRLRSRAAVDEMTWDRGGVTVTITSDIEQNLSVSFAYTGEEQIVYFKKGETKTVNFEFAQLH